ncbi:hypothetical protein L2E82_31738 [Cichorium intybus]|uniref:Uncharacterized protein n=1 Tax=Cichorium intybus TaxID=13427 RepID=A0ACB9BIS0_CICIN|nr:hypothetical protein L2E82_31738 [Cichorium intybus]
MMEKQSKVQPNNVCMEAKRDVSDGGQAIYRSFKEVVSGARCIDKNDHFRTEQEIRIPDSLIIENNDWLNCRLIGEMKDLDLLAKCFSIFKTTGIGECSVIYIGGLSVLLRFENARVANAFLNEHKESWSHWFAWLNMWDPTMRATFRAVWINVYGVPPLLWSSQVGTSL